MKRPRITFTIILTVTVVLGLLSRRASFLPSEVGDALWAVMVFSLIRIIWPRWRPVVTAAASLSLSFLVEFSQLIQTPWLNSIRSTFIGHMALGQGFLWLDLVAYTFGIAFILLLTLILIRRGERC